MPTYATCRAPDAATTPEQAVRYSMSGGLVGFLQAHGIGLALTSYQSGRLYLLSRNPKGGLMVNEQNFHKAMGLSVGDDGAIHLATLASMLLALSASVRFEGSLNTDLNDITMNLVPFPQVGASAGVQLPRQQWRHQRQHRRQHQRQHQ